MADDDHVEFVAGALHDAYYLDTKEPRTWPPVMFATRRAWRRVAAQAIDLAREDRL